MTEKNSKSAVGVFTSSKKAEQALNELKASGFPMEKVSILAKDIDQSEQLGSVQTSDRIGNQNVDTTGAVGDALTSATWGGVLVGLSSLALPGIGAVLAAGSAGVALLSSIAGVAVSAAATNNLVQALAALGIPEERARVYSDRLQQGDYLVILDGIDDEIHRAEGVLSQQGIQYWGVYDSAQVKGSGEAR
ncbi:general stress protein [Fischerella sp. PCC 9605]|uniref:general stress protein n=1 Tax=Fischerella sp. PCC 9605 TaxID=1173024 RepID=UPI00047D5425|nr:general stress protein [Fischerella sp. PCC 9605]